MPATVPNTLNRLQFDLPKALITMIDKLSEVTGFRSRREFVEHAITLFAWAIRESKAGRQIASIDPGDDGYTAVMMPCLENLRHGHTENKTRKTEDQADRLSEPQPA